MLEMIGAWFKVAYEFVDFAYSAVVNYANTPEGAADWQEVETALIAVGLMSAPPPHGEGATQAVAGAESLSETSAQVGAEQAPHERLAAASRTIRRPQTFDTTTGEG